MPTLNDLIAVIQVIEEYLDDLKYRLGCAENEIKIFRYFRIIMQEEGYEVEAPELWDVEQIVKEKAQNVESICRKYELLKSKAIEPRSFYKLERFKNDTTFSSIEELLYSCVQELVQTRESIAEELNSYSEGLGDQINEEAKSISEFG